MDVQAKINCSLDDLIKLQRKTPRGEARGAAATPQKRAAPQRVSMKEAMIKKSQKPGRQQQQQQQKYNPRQQQGSFARQQQHLQQGRGLSVADKISLPLDTVIAKQQQRPNRQQQQQQQKDSYPVGKKQQVFVGRRGAFLASRDEQRSGRLRAAAAAAARSAPRGAAAKSLAAAKNRGARIRTPHQQVVETLKAAAFKSSAPRRNRISTSTFARDRARTAAATSRGRRLANGRLPLRRQPPATVSAASRANTSLARHHRPLGPVAARRTAPVRATAAPTTARSSSSYPDRQQYSAPPAAARPLPIDRRRPPAPAAAAAPPSYAADPEILANIKIMATLDTVPAPLPQQRGSHVAIPAAMQQQQQQQQQQQPSRAVGGTAPDAGTLSSRFGY